MDLPQSLRNSIFERGAILHYAGFENIDHGKFFVILGVYDNKIAGFSFINSNINRNIIKGQEQLDLQYPILPEDYPFLKHVSFRCASDIERYEISEFLVHYDKGEITVISNMKPEHMQEIIEVCRKSRIIRNSDKKKFLY